METGGKKEATMYVFATLLLLGLAVATLVKVVERFLVRLPEVRAALLLVLGIAVAWIGDFNLFALWAMPLRATWMEIGATGLILGGLGVAWYELIGYFGGLMRKVQDEAMTMEKTEGLRIAS
jgi:uncharacterized membrane protein